MKVAIKNVTSTAKALAEGDKYKKLHMPVGKQKNK